MSLCACINVKPWHMLVFLLPLVGGGIRGTAHAQTYQETRQVLVINSYHQGYKWTDEIVAGITDQLMAEQDNVMLSVEYMDTKRLLDEAYLQKLYDLYAYKFQAQSFDVILTSDDNAFNFVRAHRDTLFPGTPVVFCGVNYFDPAVLEGDTGFTGVNETADIKATLDLMLKLHPKTKQIVIVNDTTTTGQRLHAYILKILPEYQPRIDITFLEDVTMAELQDTLSILSPTDTLVLYTLFLKDKAGTFFEFDESATLVAESSPVPVYGTWDFSLGYGIVGGKLASGYYQGATAAELALRILRGERVEDIPVVETSPNHYLFDYEQLQRWHIPIWSLPEKSQIINRPVTFYTRYRSWVWGSSFLGLILIVTIVVVSRNNAALRRADLALQDSNRELREVQESLAQHTAKLQDTVNTYVAHLDKVQQGQMDARLTINEDLLKTEADIDAEPLVGLGYHINEMTASLQQMIAQEREQHAVIEAQQQAIYELSTPIIPIVDVPGAGSIIVMPLIGHIDSRRAQDVMRGVLAGITQHHASVLILDVTGVPIVDTGVANHLNKTIQAARLKGTQTLITGISDTVAETLVDLGINWQDLETLADLRIGLIRALNKMGLTLRKK